MILKQVHDTNWRAKGQPEKVFTVTHIKAPKTAEDEFIEIQTATGTPVQRWAVRSLRICKLVLRNVASLLSAELRFATLFMAIIWFCMAFRATAFGVLNALCKLAAILGSSIFASFVGITKAIPILLSLPLWSVAGSLSARHSDYPTRDRRSSSDMLWGL